MVASGRRGGYEHPCLRPGWIRLIKMASRVFDRSQVSMPSAGEKKSSKMRLASIERDTAETKIRLELNLEGAGQAKLSTGIGFFDHMLALLAKHSLMDLTIEGQGDLHVDAHHTVEDVGICLGKALAQALGDKSGIRRYGSATIPMDEALV